MIDRHFLRIVWLSIATLACGFDIGSDPPPNPQFECTINTDLLVDGGVGRDGIPALTGPDVVPAAQSSFADTVRVLGVVFNDVARAYPMPILWHHEIVNDVVGGVPVVVSYCPLTGSGIAFDPVIDGDVRNFGVSGILMENNLVMFDRATNTLWSQMSVGSICGLERGRDLPRHRVVETTWAEWRRLYPQSTILSLNTGFVFPYDFYPYGDYAVEDNTFVLFDGSDWDFSRPAKELVLGVYDGPDAQVFPFGTLRDRGAFVTVNSEFKGSPILTTFEADSETAMAWSRVVGGETLTFDVSDADGHEMQDRETGSTWTELGHAVDGPLAGSRLEPVADAYVAFWFAWSVFYPDLTVIE